MSAKKGETWQRAGMTDPREDMRAVERLVDAARKAQDGNYDILREALEPFDAYDDEDDDTGPKNRYRFGCAPCSVATDQYGIDRSGEDHSDHETEESDIDHMNAHLHADGSTCYTLPCPEAL